MEHIYYIDGSQCGIKVKFKGFTSKWNENINLNESQHRIKPVGALSKAFGWAKYDIQY